MFVEKDAEKLSRTTTAREKWGTTFEDRAPTTLEDSSLLDFCAARDIVCLPGMSCGVREIDED